MAENWNPNNLRSFGDMDSDVFVAPLGTAKPTSLDTLPDPWAALGALTEDGGSESVGVDVQKWKIFQGASTAKTKNNGTEKTMQVSAAETNPLVFELFYGSNPAVVTAGVAEIEIPEGIKTVSRAVAFKFTEGDIIWIRYNTKADITDRGTVTYSNSDMASREMTFDLLGKDYWLTNDPAFVGA